MITAVNRFGNEHTRMPACQGAERGSASGCWGRRPMFYRGNKGGQLRGSQARR